MQMSVVFFSTHGLTHEMLQSSIRRRIELDSSSILLFELHGYPRTYDTVSDTYIDLGLHSWADVDVGTAVSHYPRLSAEEAEQMESSRYVVFLGNGLPLLRWTLLAVLEPLTAIPGEGFIDDDRGHLVPWRDFLARLRSDPAWDLECRGPEWASRAAPEDEED